MSSTFNRAILSTEDKEYLETIKNGDPYTVLGFSVYQDWTGKKVLKLEDTSGVFLIDNINPELFNNLEESKYYTLDELGVYKTRSEVINYEFNI